MSKPKLVMVGNGMAGVRTLEELLKISPDHYDITVFGAEPHPNYNRILLSPVLAGEMTVQDIILNDHSWYADNNIKLHTGKTVSRIDRLKRKVIAEDGTEESYDRLLLATGSTPFMLPVPGNQLPGVISYRDIKDTDEMIEAAKLYQHAVVIGGGLLGLEAANGLKLRGMDVTVVHAAGWLLERQLDETAGKMLQKSLEDRGLKFLLDKMTEALIAGESGRVAAVRFKDGMQIPADLVVMAVGIRPNTALAESAGIYCNRGIVVNDTLQTYDPKIYAVGECVAHRGVAYGLVAPLFEQGKVAANHLANFGIGRYTGSVTSTKLKVTGIDLFSAGDFTGSSDTEEIVLNDAMGGVYKKLVIKDNKLVGGVLYGDTADGPWYFQMLRDGQDIHEIRDHLMFGQSHVGDVGHQGHSKAAAMADSAEVCGCNGITKGTIVKAIKEKGLFTLDDIKKHTKASSSCGSCANLCEQILSATIGGAYTPAASNRKPVCGCTDHSHQEVRDTIRQQHLIKIADIMHFMEWKTPDGCDKCRPALNYYLISTWPKEARDDPRSRYINERAHANIQKDGTFSVVPRMWGGLTTSAELRRIADVAEKYQVPTIKVTGGQRIDLLGIKKEDLISVWKDLDMPSGHAYGKSIRTVKTCVGMEHCRFGTQLAMNMGVKLEKMLFDMYAPHKVKLAVSGCPRNCAEAGIKDVGVIGVDSGYELYVGGNGGIKTEVAQFFVKVKNDEEVMEYAGAFLQLYREEGFYLERTCHYLERVGLDHTKSKVVEDDDNRKALYARLLAELKDAKDPWAERVAGVAKQEYEMLSV
ncbi:Nitrite reductase (NAD(P)H) [Candidatus Propionivibrio aalborgensis]|uniref:Nitrite reductase (NAD(P)H) n=1 Tax=Candidatus Propionivibrio aalborgensis TaxID=1860101 RepID=A0A1A8Y1Z2_9RHOO|nr:nitrite reductase large subunit NirB [Candidatus Propionivibrio aalborgensis]MBK7325611.1 NAD(P)/FAD-dependent oxidoreductase [Propionivibrio sp.]MBK7562941.1 NAD(P)/FAD-dependent oxidoreductase [Propionivibrio sp.]MBK9029169.1 NAD(P)/FAD-dependent oxidoreductase [Propionivibrio sp.]SBT11012.1 Nitrite reductase (NAD(P)H) [Candidatus Propionivibrio aalborgensis]HRC59474.1 nitrite reductase large subunit NirB [Candidatus Propionivibrio aalborgensis]